MKDAIIAWFTKFKNIVTNFLAKPAVKDTLNNWVKLYNEERVLFLAEMATVAAPIIKELSTRSDLSGSQKRDLVVERLVSLFAKHALVLAGRIAVSTLKDMAILANQQEYVAQKLAAENDL